jgi:hypothetical protein
MVFRLIGGELCIVVVYRLAVRCGYWRRLRAMLGLPLGVAGRFCVVGRVV